MADDYQFDDLDAAASTPTDEATEEVSDDASTAATTSDDKQAGDDQDTTTQPSTGGGGNGNYASELFSKQIKAKFRTFFIDLKESSNGKFVKISEKSHGRKSTIMMDAEDVPVFIEALKEVSEKL